MSIIKRLAEFLTGAPTPSPAASVTGGEAPMSPLAPLPSLRILDGFQVWDRAQTGATCMNLNWYRTWSDGAEPDGVMAFTHWEESGDDCYYVCHAVVIDGLAYEFTNGPIRRRLTNQELLDLARNVREGRADIYAAPVYARPIHSEAVS